MPGRKRRKEESKPPGTRSLKYDSKVLSEFRRVPSRVRIEREAAKRGIDDVRTYRWINVRTTIPSVLAVIARYCAVWPRARCTGIVETKRGSLARTNFLLAAHERYSGKCHGFISMLEGTERERERAREREKYLLCASLPHTTRRLKSAITETRRARSGRAANRNKRPCKS